MIQGFYSAVVGAQQQMQRMNVQGNNISNVNTYGFKAQVPSFQALMYRMQEGAEGSQLPRGSGAYMSGTATNWQDGVFQETGRDLDYAIVGEGYFALYEPGTGEISFTRDGSFTLSAFQVEDQNAEGGVSYAYYLSDGEGRQVLNQSGYPIQVTDPSEDLQVGVFTIQYQDGLQRDGSSRFLMGDKNGLVWASDSEARRGMLEQSNTDLATELSQVIEAQRSYSYVLKMVQTADEVETSINGLTG
ncbi:flagellar hook-basal body protein [uncultured Flavonifractor sp.]|uniref:flagellar hook-basal body protein n=1 Tax=uncultured Flavonifractor sp. TaxID=1193534 RepID=UPI00261BFA25|nr:flagellar hook-basal body complex protein [uncultured Flavonifractor sp.]